jgi:hypothetical protein
VSTSVELPESLEAWVPPLSKPLDPAVWDAWIAKGRAEDQRSCAARIKVVTWISMAGLLIAAGLWSRLAPFEVVVRFLVTGGALVVMFEAFRVRHYALVVVFAVLALLYNPLVPVFDFSGEWQRAVVAASAIPFVATLAWRKGKKGTK